MNFKLQTDYALRTLLFLAELPPGGGGGQASVQQIADAYRISRDHLFKVVQNLVRLGYVGSRSGRSGGIRLARDAAAINCGEVVAAFEGRNGLLPCVHDPGYCVLEPGCTLRLVLIRAETALYAELEKLTLADLVAPKDARPTNRLHQLSIRGNAIAPALSAGGRGKPS
jgi:Rrf2 family nitric oxide-sensitive transcriptional repressor